MKPILARFKALLQGKGKEVALPSEAPGQKRKLTRMRCDFRVDCVGQGKMFSGRVIDMSLTGMRLEMTRAVPSGTSLGIKYDTAAGYLDKKKFDIDTVQTKVLWCRRKRNSPLHEAGVSYADSPDIMARSWVKHHLQKLGFEAHGIKERRKQVRVKGTLATLILPTGESVDGSPGTIHNLSTSGCLLEAPSAMREQSRLRLKIGPLAPMPAVTIEARVLRCEKVPDEPHWMLGVEFTNMRQRDVLLLGRYLGSMLQTLEG